MSIDLKYYEMVLETQNNAEILKAELGDLIKEVKQEKREKFMTVNPYKGKIDSSLNIEEKIFPVSVEIGKDKSKIEIIGYTGSDSTAATLFAWEEIPKDLGGGKILTKMNFYLSDTKDADEWKKYKITVEEIT